MFKHLFFPSVSRHVLVQGSNESYTKTCLHTEGKKKCLNILYLGMEGVVFSNKVIVIKENIDLQNRIYMHTEISRRLKGRGSRYNE